MLKKIFIQFFILLFLLESFSYIYFRFISADKKNLENYINRRESTESYKFYPNVGLVMPKPNTYINHYTKEFNDSFITKDVFNLGFGLFDDGIDDRKIKSIALGYSFTKGVGYIDNLINGWVELVEKKMQNIDIANLGGFGPSIHTQKYFYDQLKKFIDHDVIIYNFFSGADYIENLDDRSFQYYIKKKSKQVNPDELQNMISDYNKRYGFKYHLEYLNSDKYKFFSVYFLLKVYDLLIIKDFLNKRDFQFKIPQSEARLNLVDDDLYKEISFNYSSKSKLKHKVSCPKVAAYCYRHSYVYDNKDFSNKIVDNTAFHINNFYNEVKHHKKFILIIHPSRRNFYPELTEINYNKLDERLFSKLNSNIQIIDIKKDLFSYHKKSSNIFYKIDGHYTVYGYKVVSDIIFKNLKKIFN